MGTLHVLDTQGRIPLGQQEIKPESLPTIHSTLTMCCDSAEFSCTKHIA